MVLLESLLQWHVFFHFCHYFLFIGLNSQLHKTPLLPMPLTSKKHLNRLVEKGTWEGCLKGLSLERSGTNVEDTRANTRFCGCGHWLLSDTFIGKQYVNEVDTPIYKYYTLSIALRGVVNSSVGFRSPGEKFCMVTQHVHLLGFK